jgi:UDP:flavonoid glycosyltransferase YjiC (YdhE family)
MSNEKFDKPENVILLASAPHSKLFPIADLVITHGGHGTIMRALANGLPLICMPMGRDQNDNAAKVQYHQIGLRLKPNAYSLKIEKAVQHVLGSQQFKIKAQRFQSELKKTNNLKDYLDEILA